MLINVWGTTSFKIHSKESNQKWNKHFRQGNYLSELSSIFASCFLSKMKRFQKAKQIFLLHYLTHYLSFVIIILFSCLATSLITFISALVTAFFCFVLSFRIFLNKCNVFKNQINRI